MFRQQTGACRSLHEVLDFYLHQLQNCTFQSLMRAFGPKLTKYKERGASFISRGNNSHICPRPASVLFTAWPETNVQGSIRLLRTESRWMLHVVKLAPTRKRRTQQMKVAVKKAVSCDLSKSRVLYTCLSGSPLRLALSQMLPGAVCPN